jgi:uncharacterized membrane protein
MTEDELEMLEAEAINAKRRELVSTGMDVLVAQLVATWVVRNNADVAEAEKMAERVEWT